MPRVTARLPAALLIAALPAPHAAAQAAGYEAASIKRSTGEARRRGIEFLPGGRFRSMAMPLLPVLGIAYNIPYGTADAVRLRLRNLPDWMATDLYDVEATAQKSAQPPSIRRMLQAVLADRLQLRIHRQPEEMPVYEMTVAKHGPLLEKSNTAPADCTENPPVAGPSNAGPACHQFQGGVGRGLLANAVDMADLAQYVSNWSDLPIVDRTGLGGLYALKTEGWATAYNDDPTRLTLEEIFDRLGLKLVRARASIEILTIDHIERPSAN